MIVRLKWLLAAAGLIALTQTASAGSLQAVVELFTSQGCSSCPPADALLADLAHRPDVVAVTLPVDYWDYLGWKDTLAQPAFSQRQKAYAQARGDRQVYTPQIVVNGHKPCIGSDRSKVEQFVSGGSDGRPALSVPVTLAERGDAVIIEVGPSLQRGGSAGLIVLPILKAQPVSIGRGENRGRTITYANVARGLHRVGEWRGEAARFEVPLATARAGADGYVVLLQAEEGNHPGVILGAAKSPGL
jgi:hypothetical protein